MTCLTAVGATDCLFSYGGWPTRRNHPVGWKAYPPLHAPARNTRLYKQAAAFLRLWSA